MRGTVLGEKTCSRGETRGIPKAELPLTFAAQPDFSSGRRVGDAPTCLFV